MGFKTSSVNKQAMFVDRLGKVEDLFNHHINQGLHPGAALAVYQDGKLIVDLYSGLSDRESAKLAYSDTMFILYSCTKPLTATCMYILWERGQIKWHEPVAKYWPEFSQNGKSGVTIHHILTHQGGFPQTPSSLTWNKWDDWDFIAKAICGITPQFEPGEVMAYHARNYGWVLGELVRRIDGRPINEFLRQEVFNPLEMTDSYLGLPNGLGSRVSRVHAMEDCDRAGAIPIYNQPEVHRSIQPSGGAIMTARDLAKFYAMLGSKGSLNGVRILSPDTVAEVTKIHADAIDKSLGGRRKRGLGLVINDARMGCLNGIDEYSFGHAGAGTSVSWADTRSGLACAYITNGFRAESSNVPRLGSMSRVVKQLCAPY